jgi:hypothetical protein
MVVIYCYYKDKNEEMVVQKECWEDRQIEVAQIGRKDRGA